MLMKFHPRSFHALYVVGLNSDFELLLSQLGFTINALHLDDNFH